jgi:hypothetical protein
MADALEGKTNQWLLSAKCEDLSADDLFSEVEHYYIEGIGGIDLAESVLAGTAAVLSLSPDTGARRTSTVRCKYRYLHFPSRQTTYFNQHSRNSQPET